jgi:putative membrane protein
MNSEFRGRAAALTAVLIWACASVALGADDATLSNESFVDKAAQVGMAEVELGQVALKKSHDSDVRAFADQMVTDHDKANLELKSVAKSAHVEAPTQLDAEHRAMVDELRAKPDSEFDAAYAKAMADGHAKALELFKAASSSDALSPALSAFAKKTLPTLQHHKQMADELAAGERTASTGEGTD